MAPPTVSPGGPPGDSPPVPLPPNAQPVPDALVGVVMSSYFQPFREAASELVPHRDGTFARMLHTTEEPWRRTITAGPEWTPIDLGWLADGPTPPALVFLVNREGSFGGIIPTPEERAAVLAREVWVGVSVGGPTVRAFRVRPYETNFFDPLPSVLYYLCAPAGPARVSVVAVPGG